MPRKTRIEAACRDKGYTASMRPRPDAAENMRDNLELRFVGTKLQ